MFPHKDGLKQGDAPHHCVSTHVRVQANQKGLKLDGSHQLLVYGNNVIVFGRYTHTIKKNRSFVSC
jgi:hypothetical protein